MGFSSFNFNLHITSDDVNFIAISKVMNLAKFSKYMLLNNPLIKGIFSNFRSTPQGEELRKQRIPKEELLFPSVHYLISLFKVCHSQDVEISEKFNVILDYLVGVARCHFC
ncbi:110aa long hypothetical protein [Pyrococcus horikoshii OT3]|uniref:Uncharacterized protein n=1 Tax=Pyrococcus horikoshii (strain ATCC 700860 / DSM 12428 / JCM 9974 / NBRC 100139 / OT-3) TaxID=70601 RepID=O58569_PYRHO|nr:110aa long hypothetical protein [Pyrococcus horikoshii OT3]